MIARARRYLAWALLAAALAASCARAKPAHGPAPELWFYYEANLADDSGLATLESVWRRAAAAGYRHVLIADPKFARLGDMDDHYFANLARAKGLATELKLDVVPGVFPIGRSNALLAHAPDLAEALPVQGTFVVRNGEARIVTEPAVAFGARPDRLDPDVEWEGGVARVKPHRGRARFMFRLAVAPHRNYHLSVRVKTADYTGRPLLEVDAGEKRIHFLKKLGAKKTEDWTTHDVVFNSLDHDQVDVWFGDWERGEGVLEWTGFTIEEAGLVNVVRRAGAPCVVAGRLEGRDYEAIRDSLLGVSPWAGQFDEWHAPPSIRTRLPEGTRLDVTWYAPAVIYGGQVMACLSEPAVDSLLDDEAKRVRAAWGVTGYMMMHDEIRSMNWDPRCRDRRLSPGQILADHVRRCVARLQGSTVYVWNDMFDPQHNAVTDYYLVNGSLAGSWEGLDPSVVIVNWNAEHAAQSLRFFAGRGHRQVIAGYFDGEPEGVRDWLAAAAGVDGVVGVMYTTWERRYDDLEAFARACGAASGR